MQRGLLWVAAAAALASCAEGGGAGLRVTIGSGAAQEYAGEVACRIEGSVWDATFHRPGEVEGRALLEGMPREGGTTPDAFLTLVLGESRPSRSTLILSPDQGAMAPVGTGRAGGRPEVQVEGVTADGLRVVAVFRCSRVAR